MASETTGQTNAAALGDAKPQPVAMEIPVTVNGASTVAGSDKRQPFSETTQTVLVFGSGAVIRLAAAVGPGQLLFVTNEKSKQEVVCQVVKTKQNGNGVGYVELKFTEAATDFWGIRTPGNGASSAAPAVPVSAAIGANGAPAKPLEQRLADVKGTTPAATQASPVQIPSVTAPVPASSALPAAQPAAPTNEIQTAPVVPVQPPATPKIPTLSEFLTQGSNGLELKARDRQLAKTERRETASAAPAEEKPLSERATATQIAGEHDNKPSLSAALGVSQNPALGAASLDLSADLPAEEVKIPSWLEPLARNSSVGESKPAEPKATEPKAVEVLSSVDLHIGENIAVSAPAEVVEEHAAAPVLAGERRAPNFGTSLALGSQTESSAGSGKGLKIALAIAALLIAAAAAWYWFVNQAPKVSAGGFGTVAEGNPASLPGPSANSLINEPASTSAADPANEKTGVSTALPQPAAAVGGIRPSGNVANTNLLAASATKSAPSSSSLVDLPPDTVVEEAARKPSLGQVRLAAPKVTRNDAAAENGTAEPGLALNAATPADSSGLSLLANKGKGPAAPLPIGGDVKVAKLMSSVPPVYPQTARTQRVSGDVTVDAQIDASGRVTATRVISGPALLQEAAMSAVRQWKYQPATLNGIPTATHLTVTVQFKLQ